MSQPEKRWDPWTMPTLLTWLFFLVVGLASEPVNQALRDAGSVVTQKALINSPGAITVAFAAYVAVFAFNTCQERGLPWADSWSRALALGVLAVIAFLPYTLNDWRAAGYVSLPGPRYILLTMGPLKLAAWLYIVSLVMRYYALGNRAAFAGVPGDARPGKAPDADAADHGHRTSDPNEAAGRDDSVE